MTFRHGAGIVSNDTLFEIPAYQGVTDTSPVQESPDNNYGARNTLLVGVFGAAGSATRCCATTSPPSPGNTNPSACSSSACASMRSSSGERAVEEVSGVAV